MRVKSEPSLSPVSIDTSFPLNPECLQSSRGESVSPSKAAVATAADSLTNQVLGDVLKQIDAEQAQESAEEKEEIQSVKAASVDNILSVKQNDGKKVSAQSLQVDQKVTASASTLSANRGSSIPSNVSAPSFTADLKTSSQSLRSISQKASLSSDLQEPKAPSAKTSSFVGAAAGSQKSSRKSSAAQSVKIPSPTMDEDATPAAAKKSESAQSKKSLKQALKERRNTQILKLSRDFGERRRSSFIEAKSLPSVRKASSIFAEKLVVTALEKCIDDVTDNNLAEVFNRFQTAYLSIIV